MPRRWARSALTAVATAAVTRRNSPSNRSARRERPCRCWPPTGAGDAYPPDRGSGRSRRFHAWRLPQHRGLLDVFNRRFEGEVGEVRVAIGMAADRMAFRHNLARQFRMRLCHLPDHQEGPFTPNWSRSREFAPFCAASGRRRRSARLPCLERDIRMELTVSVRPLSEPGLPSLPQATGVSGTGRIRHWSWPTASPLGRAKEETSVPPLLASIWLRPAHEERRHAKRGSDADNAKRHGARLG